MPERNIIHRPTINHPFRVQSNQAKAVLTSSNRYASLEQVVAAGDTARVRQTENVFPIAERVLHEMVDHCQKELPYEACGLLSGGNGRAVTIWKMENADKSLFSFSMKEEQILSVFTQMEKRGEQLVAIYHSHPTAPAYPSPYDIEFANYPEAAYLILSLAGEQPEIGCFRITGKQVTLLHLAIC
ncbi:M67 family metallopeptidase [Brevibacillus thermoruber]|uniref:M67 family metallopeptidase n=1 Tax=Brevibacillus thermoruber TaxID=33942 RepID=A0A9X3Z575_9BACL|nr:M67 family metallopeptidase [Brevibacillus thermoruber]MDA5110657.1 M67 family metallopeptidase [Brevibacillus thermoruber]